MLDKTKNTDTKPKPVNPCGKVICKCKVSSKKNLK